MNCLMWMLGTRPMPSQDSLQLAINSYVLSQAPISHGCLGVSRHPRPPPDTLLLFSRHLQVFAVTSAAMLLAAPCATSPHGLGLFPGACRAWSWVGLGELMGSLLSPRMELETLRLRLAQGRLVSPTHGYAKGPLGSPITQTSFLGFESSWQNPLR